MKINFDELIERIVTAIKSMDGNDLADLYNSEFGDGMTYLGNDEFEQSEN